ncbi:MAG: chromosome segregation protein SMC [Bdellovibrionota bacterium]|nr:chromosome segregation protein SMC [Pseudobdellovibrionaceae bacterium]|tara:strand:- start:44460 stop:48062 length:3603 start_codon:yes stop_codon:yes gene_type:complete
MRIKKLELCGFKSFKDRTVIHFHEGITGIVGPNGCGKSNIVDALVWAMGEQSAKHLRGSNMSDVIFGGAEGYAPGGMAEVSITLENDGGAFPAKYLNHSEIMVTRKLHRSGESEYLVNKQPARLRDITEVFMDTGAGAKGFSIIEQGAIGKIVTAKPLDRRSLIEEAAGITKFKARKKESQRKLVQTEQNLVRINDIVTELKRRIDALQRQAKKAERYRRIKEELEDLDLWLSSKKFLKLKDDSDEAEKVFADAQDTEVGSLSDLEQIETELETLKLEMLEKEKALEVEQIKHEELKDNVRRKEMELQSLSFEVEQAKRKGEMTENIAQELETRREALAESVEGLKLQTTELETSAENIRAEYETKKEAFDNIHESIVDLETELNTSRRSLNELSGRESADAARLSSLESQLDELSTREESSGQSLAELREQKDEFEGIYKKSVNELENSRQMQLDIMKDVDNFQENRDQIFANTENKRKEVADFKEELNLVTSRLYGLENLQASFEGFEEGVKNVMLWHRKRYEATADGGMQEVPEMLPISEVVSVPEDYEVAMEAALGGRLQVLLTENQDLSLGAIDYLKDNNTGRSSFLSANADDSQSSEQSTPSGEGFVNLLTDVVSAPDKYSQSVQLLLNKVAIVDSVRTALRMRPAYPGWTFVTKDGDTLSADGVLTGGAQDSADSGILKRKREIQDLSQKKEEWAGKLALATTALEKLEKQLKQIDTELEEAKKAKYEQEIRLAELKKDVERSEKEFQNAERAFTRQEEEFSQLSAKKAKLEEDIDALASSLEETRTQKMQTEERVTELDEELVSTKLGIGDLQTSVTDLKVDLASKDQELSGLRRQLEMQEQSLSDVMAKINSVSADAAQNTELMSENQIQLEQEKVALEQQIGEVERFAEKFSAMKDSFEQESAELKESEADLLKRRRVYTDRQQKMNDAQLKLEQAKMKETYLIDQVKERYLINLAEVAENYREREGDMEQAERDVTELREKLKKMGEVNLSAIEEYDDTIERYEFLSKQQEDLLAAKKELNRVIDRINRICSKRFRDTFEAVNERFKTAFPVLFGGGEAKLTLIEDEEKDEMGIDIMARPPGKKLQSVSLLSGGEKALTAVALIFSIFLVKPSPYCLLDEVDAPLDDANVTRYNDLVQEMSKRSQIIVVTHNKHTMGKTNKIYGVTMQERGVSKMVSVNLDEASEIASL